MFFNIHACMICLNTQIVWFGIRSITTLYYSKNLIDCPIPSFTDFTVYFVYFTDLPEPTDRHLTYHFGEFPFGRPLEQCHLDMENIMLTVFGGVKMCDFAYGKTPATVFGKARTARKFGK